MPLVSFTPVTARLAGLKSAEVRRQRKINARLAVLQPPGTPHVPHAPQHTEDYQPRVVTRVRKQITHLNNLFDSETDPQKLDRLASALARLYEIERLASGRPLPGSMRPSPAPTRRQSQSYAAPMIEDDVATTPAPEAPAPAKPQTYTGPETG